MSSLNRTRKRDKVGCEFEVGICGPESSPDIKKMYDGFLMLAISQGLPPAEKQTRDRWIENLLEFGRNVLTWVEGNAVGHAAIIPDFDRGHGEYVIFVIAVFIHLVCAFVPAAEVRDTVLFGVTPIVPVVVITPQPPVRVTV